MAEKKNKAQLRLEAHQKKMIQFQEDIKKLGNPNDYTNKANYTGKVNELRQKYGVAGIGKDLNTYMNKLKQEEGKLKKVVTSRYIKRAPAGLVERLLIDDYDNTGTRYSDKNSLGYKINPDYVESLDPTGETQLKKAEALRIEKQDDLRGNMTDSEMKMSEEGTWGPSPTWGVGNGVNINITGNQPANANQLAINKDYSLEREHYQDKVNDPDSVYNKETKQGNLKEGTANRKEYAISKDQYREFGAQLEQMKKMGASQKEINKRLLKIKNSPITSLGMEM